MIDESVQQSKPPADIRTATARCIAAPAYAQLIEAQLRAQPETSPLGDGTPAAWSEFVTIKESTVRTIARGTLRHDDVELDVHVKVFRPARLSDRARDAVRGSRAEREFHNLVEARQRGLPCVEPIAAGVLRGSHGSRSFLITRTLPGEPLPRGPLEPDTAGAVGRLLRAAHDAGLHAADLHAGNVLRTPAQPSVPGGLALLDLTSAHLAQPLDDDERARGLAFFCLDLDGSVADPAARPLTAAYGATEALLDTAAQHGRHLRTRALASFGRRALRRCHHTTVVRERGKPRLFLHRPAAAHHAAARKLLATPPPPHKSGRRGSVHLGDDLVLKQRDAAAARRLFRAAYLLQYAGVPAATPVALELDRGQGKVVFQRVPNPDLQREIASGALADADLTAAASQLGRAVGRMHAHGLRNRDLKLENLVRDPATGAIVMVDLDGVRRRPPLDGRGRAADLGRLLAAYDAAGAPGDRRRVLMAFVRGYDRSVQCLRSSSRLTRHQRQCTEARASAWASAHPNTPTA